VAKVNSGLQQLFHCDLDSHGSPFQKGQLFPAAGGACRSAVAFFAGILPAVM
jgi:hypothetical protein